MSKQGIPLSEYTPIDGRLPVSPAAIQRAGTTVPLNALNVIASVSVDGYTGVTAVLSAGTLTATLTPEYTYDNSTWLAAVVVRGDIFVRVTTVTVGNPNGALQLFFLLPAGVTKARVRLNAYTSGSALCTLYANTNIDPFGLNISAAQEGQVPSINFPSLMGGKAITGALPTAVAINSQVPILADVYGRLIIRQRDTFAIQAQPAVTTQATISQAAAGPTVKNVCTSITCTLTSTAAPTAGSVIYNLRDGGTGAGTILWSCRISMVATAGEWGGPVFLSNLWIEGSANTAMTLETSAAPPGSTFATVAMTGTTTV